MLVDQARSTYRYQSCRPSREQRLRARLTVLAHRHPRYGYRRMSAVLRAEGWEVNRKAVQRLWGQAGLQVKARRCPRRKVPGRHCHIRGCRPNEIWSYDFVRDRTKEGRPIRVLSVVDEYTRTCLALAVGRSMTAEDVVDVLEGLMWRHGTPTALRSDNGSEFVAQVVQDWLHGGGVQTLFIAPGCP